METETETPKQPRQPYENKMNKSQAELKQIAIDLFDGKIFCDRNLRDIMDARMVFMVIGLGGMEDFTEQEMGNIGLLYEYLDKAGPRSVNGYPCFFSVQLLTKVESEKMFVFYDEYKALNQNFQRV